MCNNDNYSCLVSFLLAILLGFLVALLIFFGLLTNITLGLIIAIISAFIISILLYVVIVLPRYNRCIRKYSCGILIGIVGTIFFAIIALSIELGTNIISAILVGLVVFFLTYLIIKFLKLLNCIIDINEECSSNEIASLELNSTLNEIESSSSENNLNSNIGQRYCKYK